MPSKGGARVGIEVLGAHEAAGNLMQGRIRARFATYATTEQMAYELLEEALIEVPRDTGSLADSGRVEGTTLSGKALMGQVEYNVLFGGEEFTNYEDGEPIDYAIWVHEIDKDYQNGKWKYLEDPANRLFATATAKVGAAVNAAYKVTPYAYGKLNPAPFVGGGF